VSPASSDVMRSAMRWDHPAGTCQEQGEVGGMRVGARKELGPPPAMGGCLASAWNTIGARTPFHAPLV